MKNNNSSERHIINNIKVVLNFDDFFHPPNILSDPNEEDIHNFLDSKIKSVKKDPEKKWITTWNHYLNHLKFFFRWLYNTKAKNDENNRNISVWVTPDFLRIKMKITNRVPSYLYCWSDPFLLKIFEVGI
jgi:hypothetical protein